MSRSSQIDPSKLKAFQDPAAGHDGVLLDESGEVVVKPCTQAETDFYQQSMNDHPKFYELMPTFMGTLSLGAPAQIPDISETLESTEAAPDASASSKAHGQKIPTETAIVLANLEHGFKRPNALDLKLGAKLYEDGTEPEKAERLDKVAAETTSATLNFRIAGMKVWNGKSFDIYDKLYGRKFNDQNVQDGFATFFSGLASAAKEDDVHELLETILAEITKARHSLERSESRMYSSSLLIVYEGDNSVLDAVIEGGAPEKSPQTDERHPTTRELKQSEESEEFEDSHPPLTHRVKMIDFAHAAWTPGQGRDENVIKGLKNIEDQMDQLIARFE